MNPTHREILQGGSRVRLVSSPTSSLIVILVYTRIGPIVVVFCFVFSTVDLLFFLFFSKPPCVSKENVSFDINPQDEIDSNRAIQQQQLKEDRRIDIKEIAIIDL